MARSSKKDPLDKYRFTVLIDEFSKAGFASISAPSVALSTKKYSEAGAHLNPLLIVDGANFAPITMTRGVTENVDFYNWMKQPFDLVYSASSDAPEVFADFNAGLLFEGVTSSINYRRDIIIEHKNRAGQTVKKYILKNAIPTAFKAASDFDAMGDDSYSIESLTIEYEGFVVISAKGVEELFETSPVEVAKRAARRIF